MQKNINIYGYMRVSSAEQCLDRQRVALIEAGVPMDKIFIDKQSGKDFNRPQYQTMKQTLQKDDLLIIKSIDRLGRRYDAIHNEWRQLTKDIGVHICVLDMPLLDTRGDKTLTGTLIADIVLQLLSYVAETERDFIRKRQREGIDAAQARGVIFGRRPIPIPKDFGAIYEKWQSKSISPKEAMALAQMEPKVFYRMVAKYRKFLELSKTSPPRP